MRRLVAVLALSLGPAVLTAQGAVDSTGPYKQAIRARWHQHIVQQLQLNQDQSAKLQATEDKYDGLRQPIQRRQVEIAEALNRQLQPGVGANNDVVTKLMAEREDNRAKIQDLDRLQDHEIAGYLTPVQRVRYWRQHELFVQKIRQFREGRQPGRPFPPRRRFR
jgi:Spy/CpxP family protein refolding chaperone